MSYFKGKDRPKTPILHINNINEDDTNLEMLQLFMCHRKSCNGGEIADWKVNSSQSPGSTTVQITYKDERSKSYLCKSVAKSGCDSNVFHGCPSQKKYNLLYTWLRGHGHLKLPRFIGFCFMFIK